MKEYYHKYYSQSLAKENELLVFGEVGTPFIFFPKSRDRFYTCKESGMIGSLAGLIDNNRVRIYCPDTIDSESWYNFEIHPADRVNNHLKYEKSILDDVVKFAVHETGYKKVNLVGVGLGAHKALNLSLKYSDLFDNIILVDGMYDIKQFIFGHYDDECYFNNPPDYLVNLEDEKYLSKIRKINYHIYTGELGKFKDQNIKLNSIFNYKDINCDFSIVPGARHDWYYWNNIIPSIIAKIITEIK